MARALKKDQVWEHRTVKRRMADAQANLFESLSSDGFAKVHKNILHEVALAKEQPDFNHSLSVWCEIVAFIRVCQNEHSASLETLESLSDSAWALLRDQGIRPGKSNLSFMFSWLEDAMARAYAARGRRWLGSWHQQIAGRRLNPKFSFLDETLERAHLRVQLNDVRAAIQLLDQIPRAFLSSEERIKLFLNLSRLFRVAADPARGLALLQDIPKRLREADPEGNLQISWEEARCEAQLNMSLQNMYTCIKRRRSKVPTLVLLEARLWALSVKSSEWLNLFLSAAQIQSRVHQKSDQDLTLRRLFEVVNVLDQTVAGSESMEWRLRQVGHLLSRVSELHTPDYEALALSAAARFLYRTRQNEMLDLCLSKLRALSLSLTAGQSEDALGLASDIFQKQVAFLNAPGIEAGWIGRSMAYGSLTIQFGKVFGRKKLNHLVRGQCSEMNDEERTILVQAFCETLSCLKGPVMKLGQISSYGLSQISEELRQEIQILQSKSKPVEPRIIRRRIEEELGKPMSQLFRSFSDLPIGTGSVGQVHAAELLDGRPVAVKVQYPNIEQAIAYDFRILRSMRPFFKILAPHLNLKSIITELEINIYQECDYVREFEHQNYFWEKFKDDPEIQVPRAYPALSTRRVLVSERIRGQCFSEFKAKSDQARRNRACTAIVRFVVSSCRDGLFNTDPHPGNYIFTEKGVACLDFGSVKRWSGTEQEIWSELMTSSVLHERERFKKAIVRMGIKDAEKNGDMIFDLMCSGKPGLWTSPGFQSLDQRVMEEQFRGLAEPQSSRKVNLPADFLYGFRVYFGHIAAVADLKGQADWSALVRHIMKI